MNENQQQELPAENVEIDGLIYQINKEEDCANIVSVNKSFQNENVIIPRSIYYKSHNYIVSSILAEAFHDSKIKKVEFDSNSEFKKIEKNAFCCCKIECLTIPSSLVNLEKGWCFESGKLMKIIVSPSNPRYKSYGDKMIIGKSAIEQENYDTLVFCSRDVKEVTIPSFIEIIGSSAFYKCYELETVKIPTDSKLRIIEECAFFRSKIESISIPSHVVFIDEAAFGRCKSLKSIEIPENSELTTINAGAFSGSIIESITIPESLINLNQGWCFATKKLVKITISPKNPRYKLINDKMIIGKSSIEQENYDTLVFCSRDIKTVTLPNFIEIIDQCALNRCEQLQSFDIPIDSKLRLIEKGAFYKCGIERISIPSLVTFIGEYAFGSCGSLQQIEIPMNSELQEIESDTFNQSAINKIFIPPHVKIIKKMAFYNCSELRQVEIPENSELITIEEKAFYDCNVESLAFPASLVELQNHWVDGSNSLAKVSISPNNPRYMVYENKMIIGKSSIEKENYNVLVFCLSDVEEIIIPNFIDTISGYMFKNCKKLKKVVFQNNSKILEIEDNMFLGSSIESVYIAPQLTRICSSAFFLCSNLQRFEIPPNSELRIIESCAFACCDKFKHLIIPMNSKLQTIESNSFSQSSIESLVIPETLVDLKDGWCSSLRDLHKIIVSPENPRYCEYDDKMIIGKSSIDKNNYDTLVFCARNAKKAKIPDFIEIIASYAFESCNQLQSIEFSTDSKLRIIEKYAFHLASISKIMIPRHINKIGNNAFSYCINLRKIEFQTNSEIQIIESDAFDNTLIMSFLIPPHLEPASGDIFGSYNSLQIIEIDKNSVIKCIDAKLFSKCKQVIIMIPVELTSLTIL